MSDNSDKVNIYDPNKIYNFGLNESEIKTIENAIGRYIQHQEEDVPQELQKRWEDHFLIEEKKLLQKFYNVSEQILDDYHEQVDNEMLHESLNDQIKKIKDRN